MWKSYLVRFNKIIFSEVLSTARKCNLRYTSKCHFNFLVGVEFFFYILNFIKQFETQLGRKMLIGNFWVLTNLFSVFLSSLFHFELCVTLFHPHFPFFLSYQSFFFSFPFPAHFTSILLCFFIKSCLCWFRWNDLIFFLWISITSLFHLFLWISISSFFNLFLWISISSFFQLLRQKNVKKYHADIIKL